MWEVTAANAHDVPDETVLSLIGEVQFTRNLLSRLIGAGNDLLSVRSIQDEARLMMDGLV